RDLWLVREGSEPVLLTQSGQDGNAEWSLDGRWIAFLSSRPMPFYKPADGEKEKTISQLYVIPASGGEAVPVTRGEESVHSFAWTPDCKSLYFVTREPWSKAKRDAYKKEWHDVQRYREGDRGDVIARISLADALANAARVPSAAEAPPSKDDKSKQEEETAEAPGVKLLAHTNYFASDLEISPDGRRIRLRSGWHAGFDRAGRHRSSALHHQRRNWRTSKSEWPRGQLQRCLDGEALAQGRIHLFGI